MWAPSLHRKQLRKDIELLHHKFNLIKNFFSLLCARHTYEPRAASCAPPTLHDFGRYWCKCWQTQWWRKSCTRLHLCILFIHFYQYQHWTLFIKIECIMNLSIDSQWLVKGSNHDNLCNQIMRIHELKHYNHCFENCDKTWSSIFIIIF